MKPSFLYIALCWSTISQAQLYNDGSVTNDNSLLSDWQNQWFNTSNGVYSGLNNALFEHHGPSSQTFVNNGSYTATAGHTDNFMGPLGVTGDQEIAGSARPVFYNLNFQNGASSLINITNTNGAEVSNVLGFSNGITTTVRNNIQSGALRFTSAASYTGGNTDAQHVDGYVSKLGTSAFTFPVGSSTDARALSISAPATSTEISTAWFAGDPSTVSDPSDGSMHNINSKAPPIISVSDKGFWDWVPVSGNAAGLTVTVSLPDVSTTPASNLRLVGWNGTQWIDLSGAATASGNTENSTLSGTIPAGTITALSIGSIDALLPVHFVSFTAGIEDCHAVLNWSLGVEEEGDRFLVERSINGTDFHTIATVQGKGYSDKGYKYIDTDPVQGNNYYRIHQVNVNGYSSFTVIKTVSIRCGGSITVYPTLTSGIVNVRLPDGYEHAKIIVINATGLQMPVSATATGLQRVVHLEGMPPEVYILQVINGNNLQTFKVLKQ